MCTEQSRPVGEGIPYAHSIGSFKNIWEQVYTSSKQCVHSESIHTQSLCTDVDTHFCNCANVHCLCIHVKIVQIYLFTFSPHLKVVIPNI